MLPSIAAMLVVSIALECCAAWWCSTCRLCQVDFPADICSRVTFVNFTVTRSSLQSQCLNQVLKSERPDIDEKRSDLLKLQGEPAARAAGAHLATAAARLCFKWLFGS